MQQPGAAAQDPEQFGRYRVKKVLGRGGMGVVYLAEDPRIGREVAIKVIRFSSETPREVQSQLRRRFEVEAHSAGGLSHPNIVTIYDIGEQDDVSYIAMEFVRGENLDSILHTGQLPLERVDELVGQLCRALDFAHDHGVVHRDIKPANILLTKDGRPKVVDFGVAKLNDAPESETTRLTQAGSVIGTPAYMSPEQVIGSEATARSDQFSLGVVVYEMLAGQVPFQGANATTVMYKIVHEPPPPLQSITAHLPAGLDEVLARALAKAPEDRYERCEHLALALRAVLLAAPRIAPPEAAREIDTAPEIDAGPRDDVVPAAVQRGGSRRYVRAALLTATALALAVAGGLWLLPATPPAEPASGGAESGTGAPSVTPPAAPEPLPAAESQAIEVQASADDAQETAATPQQPTSVTVSDPEPATATRLRITSRPEGATVILDDAPLPQKTPAEVELQGAQRHQLRIELPGYRTASWAFTLDDLNETQRQSGELHFPLAADTPPGRLSASASGYEVTLLIDGRRHGPSGSIDIELPPGEYVVQIEAPEVFLSVSRTVQIASAGAVELPLPSAYDVQVAATPGNCRVSIDGRFVDVTPFRVRLAAGEHDFEFVWPTLDKTVRRSERISRAGQQLFASPDGGRP